MAEGPGPTARRIGGCPSVKALEIAGSMLWSKSAHDKGVHRDMKPATRAGDGSGPTVIRIRRGLGRTIQMKT